MDKPVAGAFRFDGLGRVSAIYDGNVWLPISSQPTVQSLQLQLNELRARVDELELHKKALDTTVENYCGHATTLTGDALGKFKMHVAVVCQLEVGHEGKHYNGLSYWD